MSRSWQYLTRALNSGVANPASWFVEWIRGGTDNYSGVQVTSQTALTYSTVWHALRLISGDIRSMPLNVYRRLGDMGDRQKEIEHPAYQLLNIRANPLYSGGSLRETMQAHALLLGNAFAEIRRTGTGAPGELILLHPANVKIKLDSGVLNYLWTHPDTLQEQLIPPGDMLHIRGLGDDGVCGYSVLSLARNSIGLGLAEERHGASTFKNSARPDVVLKTMSKLDKQDADRLLSNWEERHAGSENKGRPALLTGNLELETIPASSNNDAQWLASREFQREEIASWFCIPANKLNANENRTSYNSLEMTQREYISQTLRYWCHVWEDEVLLKLFTPSERSQFLVEHNASKLIELDTKTKTEVLAMQLASMMRTRNEARRELNLNSVEGGDEFINPNTTSTTTTQPDDNDEPEEEAISNRQRDQLSAQLTNTIRRMANNERNHVLRASKREENFVAWSDKFYESWVGNLATALTDPVETINVFLDSTLSPQDIAAELVAQSRSSVMKIAGYSFPDNLTDNIEANWSADAEIITQQILTGDLCTSDTT